MKQLERIERKETKVPQNFMSDTLKFLESLNQLNNEPNINAEEFKDAINEFAASFIYLRESFVPGQSNIQALNTAMVEINQLVNQAGSQYQELNNQQALELLEDTMNQIINFLNDMNDKLQDAEQEELESKRIEAIERMFISTQADIKGAETIIKRTKDDLLTIEGSINTSADAIRSSVEAVDEKIDIFEKQAVEIKNQCDGINAVSQTWKQSFEEWKGISTKQTEESLDRINKKIEETQHFLDNQNNAEIKNISDKYEKVFEKIEKKGNDALDKIDDVIDQAKANYASEGFKQVFTMIGGGFAIVNFILILIMFFIK